MPKKAWSLLNCIKKCLYLTRWKEKKNLTRMVFIWRQRPKKAYALKQLIEATCRENSLAIVAQAIVIISRLLHQTRINERMNMSTDMSMNTENSYNEEKKSGMNIIGLNLELIWGGQAITCSRCATINKTNYFTCKTEMHFTNCNYH